MKRKTQIRLALLICMILIYVSGSSLWIGSLAAAPFERATMPITFRSWTLAPDDESSETTISQFLLPVITSFSLRPQTDLVVAFGGAATTMDQDGGETSNLNGPTDATIQLFQHFADKRALVHIGLSAPTGKTALDSTEYKVAVVLGSPLLGFPLREYGRGLDLSLGTAYARTLYRGIALGFGGGLIVHGAYSLLEETEESEDSGDKYKPGMEVTLTAGLDAELAIPRGSTLRLDGTLRLFGTDSYADNDIFTQGKQFEFQGITRTRTDRFAFDLVGRLIFRQNNIYYSEQGSEWREIEASPGTQIFFRASGQYRLSKTVWSGLMFEWSGFSGSDSPGVNGKTFGIGPTISTSLGGQLALRLHTAFLTGAIDGDDNYPGIDLSGFNLALLLSLKPS